MRIRLARILLLLSAIAAWNVLFGDYALGQNLSTFGYLTSQVSGCTSASQSGYIKYQLPANAVSGTYSVGITLAGTWTGTVQFAGSVDGATYTSIAAAPQTSGSSVTSTTSNGSWNVSAGGLSYVCVYAGAYTSGTIGVTMMATKRSFVAVTPSAVSTALSALPNCGTSGYVYSPATNTCVANTGGGGASTAPTTQLYKGNGSANSVVAATPGTDYITPSNTATATNPGLLFLAPGQTSSTLAPVATGGRYDNIFGGENSTLATRGNFNGIGNYQVSTRNQTFTGTNGWSIGSVAASDGFYGLPWSVDQLNQWNVNFNRRGITQVLGSFAYKSAIGDFAYIYAYMRGTGGSTAPADEGQVLLHGQTGQMGTYPQGVVASSTATGLTALSITPTTYNAAGGQTFCDGCYLMQKVATSTGHYAGIPAAVNSTSGHTLYYTQPTDATYTVSTYADLTSCTGSSTQIPQVASPQVPQSDTCVFTPRAGSSATAFTPGIATIAGQQPEQVNITAVTGTGPYTVTFSHTHANSVGYTTLWQGGARGNTANAAWVEAQPLLAGGVGMPAASIVFGSTDTHTLATGTVNNGSVVRPIYFYDAMGVYSLSRTGTTVTAGAANAFDYTFLTMANAVISGCGNALDGPITAVTESLQNFSMQWTSPTSGSLTCANATISLPPSTTAFTLYPYAEMVAGDPYQPVYNSDGTTINSSASSAALNTTRVFSLEYNNVPWTNGAQVFQAHPNAQGRNGLWIDDYNFNPSLDNNQNPIFISQSGIVTGQGAAVNVFRNSTLPNGRSAYSLYTGGGGSEPAAPFINMNGPNAGSNSTLPINGTPIWKYFCTLADPTCANPQKLWDINSHTVAIWNDATQTTTFPSAGGVTTTNLTASGLTSGQCVQTGTGGLLTTTGSACGSGSSGPIVNSGHATMTAGTVNVTFARTFASTAYDCTTTDTTTTALSHDVPASRTTTGTTIVGNGTDTVSYTCIAN